MSAIYETQDKDKRDLEVVEDVAHAGAAPNLHGTHELDSAGLAIIEQKHAIPTTGKRKPTTKREYMTFCLFCEYGRVHSDSG